MRRQTLIGLLVAAMLTVGGGAYALSSYSHIYQHAAESSGTIEGHVLDVEGQPIVKAQVFADRIDSPMGRRHPFVLTDEEGIFLIKGLNPGTYMISAAKEADGYAPTDSMFHSANLAPPLQVTVHEGQQTSNIVIHLGPKAARLVGHVVDASTNRPIAIGGVQITLRRVDNPDYTFTASPNLQGEYKILVPPVPLTIEVSGPGYETWVYSQNAYGNHPDSLILKPGEGRSLRVLLHRQKQP